MSTTSGIHVHPFDPFASVSPDAHDEHPMESDKASAKMHNSPAASCGPVGVHEHSVEKDYDPLLSPYAPKKRRAEPDSLQPVPGSPIEASRRYSREMSDNWRSRSLEPERMMPPPAMRRDDNLLPSLITLIVSVLATSIAAYLLVERGGSQRLSQQMAANDSKFISHPTVYSSVKETQPTTIVLDDVLTARAEGEVPPERPSPPTANLSQSEIVIQVDQPRIIDRDTPRAAGEKPPERPTAGASERGTVMVLQPRTPSAKAPSSGETTRVFDAEEIDRLMRRGERFLAVGDVLAARIAFQRAAEAGDGNAAVALGATYDPTELAKLGVVGTRGDVAKAQSWYQKAEEFGSREATGRLQRRVDE
jgi:hypothetical protein